MGEDHKEPGRRQVITGLAALFATPISYNNEENVQAIPLLSNKGVLKELKKEEYLSKTEFAYGDMLYTLENSPRIPKDFGLDALKKARPDDDPYYEAYEMMKFSAALKTAVKKGATSLITELVKHYPEYMRRGVNLLDNDNRPLTAAGTDNPLTLNLRAEIQSHNGNSEEFVHGLSKAQFLRVLDAIARKNTPAQQRSR